MPSLRHGNCSKRSRIHDRKLFIFSKSDVGSFSCHLHWTWPFFSFLKRLCPKFSNPSTCFGQECVSLTALCCLRFNLKEVSRLSLEQCAVYSPNRDCSIRPCIAYRKPLISKEYKAKSVSWHLSFIIFVEHGFS